MQYTGCKIKTPNLVLKRPTEFFSQFDGSILELLRAVFAWPYAVPAVFAI
jgi:hypothetical protein